MEYFVAAPKANEIISRYRAFQEEVRPIAGEPCMAEVRERERENDYTNKMLSYSVFRYSI
jgi:hypothetical protein